MPVAGALGTWAYEAAYFSVTGRSFLEVYRSRQVPEGALIGGSPVARTAYSAVWYTARVIWYAFPWSVFAGAVAIAGIRTGRLWPWRAGDRQMLQGAWFATMAGLTLMAAFSLAHRKADRYIFVVYFLLASAGAVWAIRRYAWLERLVERMDRPWTPAALFVLLFLLRLVSLNALPEFTFWRS
jgi:hypothetical protein